MAHSLPSGDNFPLSSNIKYELLREIAHGHISKVYKAKEIGTGNVLAVKKFMQPERKGQQVTVKIAIRNEVHMLELVRGGVSITAIKLIQENHGSHHTRRSLLLCFVEHEPG
jgi:serine/threonine protein kinase